MIGLEDVTVILVLKVDCERRFRNARTVLGFLDHHFKTKVFIVESGPSRLDFLSEMKNLEIKHVMLENEERFHRTRYINMMLEQVETPVVANHDIDVVLPVSSYVESRDMIVGGHADVVYPYGFGDFSVPVPMSFDQFGFRRGGYDTRSLFGDKSPSKFGHCVFFDTDHYRKRGGENEEFVSYGPEDIERAIRFKSLGSRVVWLDGLVYHFEHPRGEDSSSKNSYFKSNLDLCHRIAGGGRKQICEHYASAEYLKAYSKVCWRPNE